ncbi:hypothetical protein ES703_71086 [subsurface metagenome]
MADPHLKKGYTRIANELLEALIRVDWNKAHKDLMFTIIRFTYGWSKKSAKLHLFSIGFMCDKSEARVSRILSELIYLGGIIRIGKTYAIQKDFDQWKPKKLLKHFRHKKKTYRSYPHTRKKFIRSI